MAKLTAKQKTFCEEFMLDLNATQAAIRAGYSKKTAQQISSETLLKPVVQEYIQELQQERSDNTSISAESVLRRINMVANRCLQIEPVIETQEGEEAAVGVYKFEHSGANKALEMLARHNGLFNDKLGITGDGISFNLNFGFDEDKDDE